jgi:hypothetical protein
MNHGPRACSVAPARVSCEVIANPLIGMPQVLPRPKGFSRRTG